MADSILDRRRTRRCHRLDEHGIVAARVRPGRQVAVVNVSTGGALVECSHRLLPGANVELWMATRERCAAIRGVVLRCAVTRVGPSSLIYHGAIGFEVGLPWPVGEDPLGYGVPIRECQAETTRGEDPTREIG